jgi:hypothetical protein
VTAGLSDVSDRPPAGVAPPRVRNVRAFIGRRRHRSWLDWYFAGFVCVFGLIYLADFLAGPLSRLSAAAGHSAAGSAASHAAAAQAVAGTGLVIGVAAGLLLLAQGLGPMALSPADASWLLPAPLPRRAVLRRSALTAALLSVVTGGLLGVLTLAMAGPYLRPGAAALPPSWLVLSAAAGALCCLAAVAGQTLAQPHPRARGAVRTVLVAVAVIAMAAAVAAGHWTALSDTVTSGFGGLNTSALDTAAVAALVLAAVTGTAAWLLLRSFPAAVLRADSARAGRTLMAASFLNLPLLSWIAEDNHWRGRLIPSRRWPKLPPPLALAWADWRRLGRRPGLLAVTVASALIPALIGAAITSHDRRIVIAAALLFGAIGAGAQGTAAIKRDLNDKALRRLLSVSEAQALMARAVLPVLLSAGWLAVAFALLVATGVLHGWLWAGVGVIAGPGVTAAVLRMAGTAPINPAERGIDLPLGTAPPWLISRVLSLALGAVGAYPLLGAVLAGQPHPSTLASQLFFSAVVLGLYLMTASRAS